MLDPDINLPTGTTYLLVIDTDAYSGNFERELGGYCVGAYDGETHGDNEQSLFRAEEELAEQIEAKVTFLTHAEYGERPVCIRATPGRLNNGSGWHYDANCGLEDEARERSIESMRTYQEPTIARAQERLDKQDFEDDSKIGAWTKEACERTIQSSLASIERAGDYIAWPAYESVAVFLSEPLTEEEFAVVERRARAYAADPKSITGWKGNPFNIRDIYQTKITQDRTEERLT